MKNPDRVQPEPGYRTKTPAIISSIRETMKTLAQVVVGVGLCAAAAYVLVYSRLPIFWEHEERLQPHVYSLTWRSGVMVALLMAITQTISFFIFRRTR